MRILFIVQQVDYEPHGIMHLSSALKAAGHEVELAVGARHDPVAVARLFRPDVVAYSVITGSQRYYLELNQYVKAELPCVFAVFGGPHPTFLPEMVLKPGVDGICQGEGEQALVDLVAALADGGPDAALGVSNWSFRRNADVIANPVRPYVEDLDSLPFPDRALVYERDPTVGRHKIKHFLTGRGCPYDCTYCFNHALSDIYRGKGRQFRQRSVDHVIEEIRWVRGHYPLEFVVFVDDIFALSNMRLAEFAEKYPCQIGLPFYCNTRADLVTAEQVRLLKEAGCHTVGIGIEAGNDRIRNELLKRSMSKADILEAARLFREAGLHFTSNNMIGLPTSALADDFETLELNIQARPSYAHVFIFQPYPRTELGQFTREQGWTGSVDDIDEIAWDHSVLNFGDAHKRGLVILHRFFALGVEFPWLVPWIKRLLLVPDNAGFWLLHKLWKGWVIKSRVHPVRLDLRETFEIFVRFMRIKS